MYGGDNQIMDKDFFFRGCIFDFNGVIVDDFPLQQDAWSQMSLKLRGVSVTVDEMVHKIRGVPSKDTLKWMSKSDDEEYLKGLTKEKDVLTEELFNSSPLFCLNKGLEKFLDELKTYDIPRTIATSSSYGMFEFAFRQLKLSNWFKWEEIVCNDGSYPGKPAPDAYLFAVKKLGLKPQECLVIEDAQSGIQSAFAARCKIVAINTDLVRLEELINMPGVIKGIKDFTEISVEEIFGIQK